MTDHTQQLARAGRRLVTSRARTDDALDAVREAVLAALAAGMTEVDAARLGQVDRMTVRKWQGKR